MCARPANPELRAEILKAATGIVESCGPDCVTMREVAAEVGYSPTTLYLYFKDKDAILAEVVVEGFRDLADFCTMSEVGPGNVDRFRQRGRAYVVWGLMHPSLYALMFETRIDAEWTDEQIATISRSGSDGIALATKALQSGDLVGIGDVVGFCVAGWAATHGVVSLANSRRLSVTAATASAPELLAEATAVADVLSGALLKPHLLTRPDATS
jgi:AcrR family transcriptional regulator